MTTRQWLDVASPIVVIVTMVALFRRLTIALGFQQGSSRGCAVWDWLAERVGFVPTDSKPSTI
jgi:hypothetical protein